MPILNETAIQDLVSNTGSKQFFRDTHTVWYNRNRQPHRIGGPAIEYNNGDRVWYQNGAFHRTDGPAVEYNNGDQEWWLHGIRHREDGPAIINASTKHYQWFLNGTKFWFDEWCEVLGIPACEKTMYILQYT